MLGAMAGVLRLKSGRERRARTHPWIFKGDVADVTDVAAGDVVTVLDATGRFVGRGWFNPAPALCCRVVTWEDEAVDAALVERRVADAVARRGPGRDAVRLVWSEGDRLPGLVVDRYGPVIVSQALTLGVARRRKEIVAAVRAVLGEAPVLWADEATPAALERFERQRGWHDDEGPPSVVVAEGDARFLVRMGSGHKTGLYLDQADNRARIGPRAAGRDVLDAFAYSAGFACHALIAGARRALCLESSPDAIAGAVDNFALNGIADRAEVRAGNAFDELRRLDRAGARFGLVVLDPPPFARSRGALDDAMRGYKEINLRAMRLLEPHGVLATFSCSHHVDDATFETMCREAAADAGVRFAVLERLTQSADHPALLTVPETRYLKGLLLRAA